MVRERRMLFDVTDIKAIRPRSGGCQGDGHTDLTRTRKEYPGVADACGFCGHPWVPLQREDPHSDAGSGPDQGRDRAHVGPPEEGIENRDSTCGCTLPCPSHSGRYEVDG